MQNTPAVSGALPSFDDRVRALEAAVRLLEETSLSRLSAMSYRIGALEEHAKQFTREDYKPLPVDD